MFIATDKQTGEKVAIKKHKQKDQDEFGLMIPTLRECQILQRMNHPNIIKVKDFFMTDFSDNRKDYPDLYMVMEYISFVSRCYGSLMSRVITICFI